MKKLMFTLFICSFTLLTSACNNKDIADDEYTLSENDYFQYAINDIIYTYDVDDGNLYYVTGKHGTYIGEDGAEHDAITNLLINVMNFEGVLEHTYTGPYSISKLCMADGRILYTADSPNDYMLYEYNKDTQSSVQLGTFTKYYNITKLEGTADKLYFIGNSKDYADNEYSLASLEDSFIYSGERIGCMDLATGNVEDLPIELPISFSKAPDGNLVIYAYDEEKGYYFTTYDPDNKSFSDKIYHALGQLTIFDVFNDTNDFMFFNMQRDSFTLTAASLSPDGGKKELIQNFPLGAMFNLVCSGDYTYSTDTESKNIIRVKNSAYLKNSKKITMYCTFAYVTPFGCGYNIQTDIVTDEELALSLLSLDESFDICSMNSMQDISLNIRNKGSFYPLNDVKGVKEYLDSCFPYIKETATNSYGDIWMLPIYIEIPCLLYNESFCRNKGFEVTSSMDKEHLFDLISRAKQDDSLTELYNTNNIFLMKNFFYQYLRSNTSFNTDLFRELAGTCKTIINYADNFYYGNNNLFLNLVNKKSDFLFLFGNGYKYQLNVSDNSLIRAASIPSLTDGKTNAATCYFLTVNPASKNLKASLQYISSLCKYLSSYNSYLIQKDRTLYPDTQVMDDLYEIYSNGDIQFTYPDELFMDDFEKYLQGEIELDHFIKEADRRLDTFLNE